MTTGIYIQVPFCGVKCTYCNFATGVFPSAIFPRYVDAVCREMEIRAAMPLAGGPKASEAVGELAAIDTVYVGGGTPSLLAPRDLTRLMAALRENFACDWREATLEADPETIAAENSAAWREAGFDRVSLGVQSFADAELLATGRRHRRAQVFSAVEILRAAGFANVSMDLIAGLPRQTRESWSDSLDELLALAPEHISIYLLETDEGSNLGREVLRGGARFSAQQVPSDDVMTELYDMACERLAAAGFDHYEISNWGRTRALRSLHNLKYWRREPYFGFGAGAHSFDGCIRQSNAESVDEYLSAIESGNLPVKSSEAVSSAEALDEELFLGLRQLEGIDFADIESRYRVNLRERLEQLAADGFIEIDGTQARLAPGKIAVSNEVFVELMGQPVP